MYVKFRIAIFVLVLACSGFVKAQNFEALYGEWKVERNIVFQRVGSETIEEYNDRVNSEKTCLASIFIIDDRGIMVKNRACGFLGCKMQYLQPRLKEVRVVENNQYTLEAMGEEIADSNIVGRRFVELLDKNYIKQALSVYDTDCQIGYGNSTLKICIVSKNKIGLYQDYNLILLRR